MIRPSALAAALVAMALGLAVAPARADTVTLKNGREIHGRLVEEQRDFIRMRSEGGVVRIEKAEIATFMENEETTGFRSERTQKEIDAENAARITAQPATPPEGTPPEGTPPTGRPPAGQTPPGPRPTPGGTPGGAPGTGAVPTAETWRWPASLTAEQIQKLTPIRDKVLADLLALGPTPEERLAAEKATPEEQSTITARIQTFNNHRRQGGTDQRRNNAGRDVAGFGVKAIPFLVDTLKSDASWTARMSAQTIGQLGATPEAKWLMYHHDVPGALIRLLDRQGADDANFLRQDAAAALSAITGNAQAWPETQDQMRTQAETAAKEAWESWWGREKRTWTAAEQRKETKRAELLAKVAKLQKGEEPEETPAPE